MGDLSLRGSSLEDQSNRAAPTGKPPRDSLEKPSLGDFNRCWIALCYTKPPSNPTILAL
jgi:hypothetical protein